MDNKTEPNTDLNVTNIYMENQTWVIQFDYNDDAFQSKLSTFGDYLFGTGLLFIGLISVLGNGGILMVFYKQRKKLTCAELFLVNLSIQDILLGTASYPGAMISSYFHRWSFGHLGCAMYAFTCYLLGVASIGSLTAVAIIRYLKTCVPNLGNRIDRGTAVKAISMVYINALFWALLPLFGISGYEPEPFGLSCTLQWISNDTAGQIYIVACSIFCVFLPLLIVVFCYSRIIIIVKKSDDILITRKLVRKQTSRIKDAQLSWITLFICCGFVIGWMPYTIVCLWGAFSSTMPIPMWATAMPVFLAKSSIAYNPFIYFFITERYRQQLLEVFFPNFQTNRTTLENTSAKNYQEIQSSAQTQACTNLLSNSDTNATKVFHNLPQPTEVKLNSKCKTFVKTVSTSRASIKSFQMAETIPMDFNVTQTSLSSSSSSSSSCLVSNWINHRTNVHVNSDEPCCHGLSNLTKCPKSSDENGTRDTPGSSSNDIPLGYVRRETRI